MTLRKLAMLLLSIIIVLELSYYILYLKAQAEPKLTMEVLNDEAKMQRIFEKELDDWQYGEERRMQFKYIMGATVIGGFILASLLPNRKI